jgi:tellurite resistance protein TehA-like permease
MVFPLGMYSACTDRMAAVTGFSDVAVVATGAFGVALAAWAVTFVGLVLSFRPHRG